MLWNDVWFRIKTSNEIEDPLRVFVSDKEQVKEYVRNTIGDRYNVPTIAVLRSPAEVDTFDFPARCAIKPTHASTHVCLRSHGEPIDRERIKKWFSLNYYHSGRERNYRSLQPKVIVEPLIFDTTNVEDYKIFCWNGVPKFVMVDIDRHINHTRKIFDPQWNEQDFSMTYPRASGVLPKPATLEEMISIARTLSASFSFVRIDLYTDGRQVLVGEITNCSANASAPFLPPSAEQSASARMFN
jgi:teichuronopeptide biosynthesis TupA-like protein